MIRRPWPMLLCLALAGAYSPEALAQPQPIFALQALRFEPAGNLIVLPFSGDRPPLATISTQGTSLVIDVPSCDFPYAEVYAKIERSPLVKAYVAAYDPEIQGLHLVIEGSVPLTAEPVHGSGLRFALGPKDPKVPLGTARPEDVVQRITSIPRVGRAIAPATTAEAPNVWTWPAPRLTFTSGPTTEQYAPEALAGAAQGVGRFNGLWEPTYGDYSLPMRLGRGAYGYQDPDYAGVDHLRTETSLELALARLYRFGGLKATSGVGYLAALTQVQNSATATSPTFFFAGHQLLHGPMLRQTVSGMAWGPLGLGLDLGWSPYIFALVDGGVAMPWLSTVRVEPKLFLFPEERVSLGYFYERTVGASFNRESSGISLGMSFSGF